MCSLGIDCEKFDHVLELSHQSASLCHVGSKMLSVFVRLLMHNVNITTMKNFYVLIQTSSSLFSHCHEYIYFAKYHIINKYYSLTYIYTYIETTYTQNLFEKGNTNIR